MVYSELVVYDIIFCLLEVNAENIMAERSNIENGSVSKKRKLIDEDNDLYLFNNRSSSGIML